MKLQRILEKMEERYKEIRNKQHTASQKEIEELSILTKIFIIKDALSI